MHDDVAVNGKNQTEHDPRVLCVNVQLISNSKYHYLVIIIFFFFYSFGGLGVALDARRE